MFSIYIYVKDPMMQVKSDKYTEGEFKKVKDLILIDDSLLVSSQMSNSLLLIQHQQKIIEKAQKQKENPFSADAAKKAGDVAPQPSTENASDGKKKSDRDSPAKIEKKNSDVPPPAESEENASLADMNA